MSRGDRNHVQAGNRDYGKSTEGRNFALGWVGYQAYGLSMNASMTLAKQNLQGVCELRPSIETLCALDYNDGHKIPCT